LTDLNYNRTYAAIVSVILRVAKKRARFGVYLQNEGSGNACEWQNYVEMRKSCYNWFPQKTEHPDPRIIKEVGDL